MLGTGHQLPLGPTRRSGDRKATNLKNMLCICVTYTPKIFSALMEKLDV